MKNRIDSERIWLIQRTCTSVPWSQRFFFIFLRERDQEQAAKQRQGVVKAMRRETKTSGYIGLEGTLRIFTPYFASLYQGRKLYAALAVTFARDQGT